MTARRYGARMDVSMTPVEKTAVKAGAARLDITQSEFIRRAVERFSALNKERAETELQEWRERQEQKQ